MKNRKKYMIMAIIILAIFAILFIIYYNKLAERNSAYYYTQEVVSDDSYRITMSDVRSYGSLIEYVNTTNPNVYIPIDEKSGNNRVEGYEDLDSKYLSIHLNSDTEIEYIESSDKVESLRVICYGDETHDLKDFPSYYPNLTHIYFNSCNFPDDYLIHSDNLTSFYFEFNTNVNYNMFTDFTSLKSAYIYDSTVTSEDLPIFPSGTKKIYIYMEEPITYDFSTFPESVEFIKLNTSYEGEKNEDTIYGLEDYPIIKQFDYDEATYITQESYDHAIKNDILGVPKDIEVIE